MVSKTRNSTKLDMGNRRCYKPALDTKRISHECMRLLAQSHELARPGGSRIDSRADIGAKSNGVCNEVNAIQKNTDG